LAGIGGAQFPAGVAMIKIAAFFLFGLAFICPAHSERFSVRCTDPNNRPPEYFATFDLESKAMVFESPIRNILRGEIESSDEQRIDFWVKPSIYKIGLVFDRRSARMIFPGFLTALETRPELIHACQLVPVRTALAILDNITKTWANYKDLGEPMQPSSFRCTGNGAYIYVTLDRPTKKILMEIQNGSPYPGEIETIEGHRVMFLIHVGSTTKHGYILDDEAKMLTWQNDGGGQSINPCIEIKLRTLLDAYSHL
jgi:hypothetical protein